MPASLFVALIAVDLLAPRPNLVLVSFAVARAAVPTCIAPLSVPGLTLEEQSKIFLAQDLDRAFAVFSGVVSKDDFSTVTVKVDRIWKGPVPEEVTFSTGKRRMPDGSIASLPETRGIGLAEKWLLFAYGTSLQNMEVSISSCGPSGLVSAGSETEVFLNKIVAQRGGKVIER